MKHILHESAERSGVESRPDQESIWSTFRFGWSAIRTWIVRAKLAEHAHKRSNWGREAIGADRPRIGSDKGRLCRDPDGQAKQNLNRPSWGSEQLVDAEKGSSGDDGFEEKDREQEGSSTLDL